MHYLEGCGEPQGFLFLFFKICFLPEHLNQERQGLEFVSWSHHCGNKVTSDVKGIRDQREAVC